MTLPEIINDNESIEYLDKLFTFRDEYADLISVPLNEIREE